MTFMRAAIAGKPDEQFPGDDQNGQSLDQAKAQSPNSGSHKPILGTARQPRTTAATQVAPLRPATAPGTQADASDSAKNTVERAHNCSRIHSAGQAGAATAKHLWPDPDHGQTGARVPASLTNP